MPCGEEPEKFFGDDNDEEEQYDTVDAVNAAAFICAGCPIRWECLADALGNDEQYGVRGGFLPAQRQQMKSRGW